MHLIKTKKYYILTCKCITSLLIITYYLHIHMYWVRKCPLLNLKTVGINYSWYNN